jgi:hypothetical protein
MRKRLNANWVFITATATVLASALFSGGCERATHRAVNVAAGEYYTEDELLKLSNSIKNQYCRQLESERGQVQSEFEAKSAELAQTNDGISTARARRDGLERDVIATEAEVRTLEDQIAEIRALPTIWKIRPGEDLAVIAALPEIYNDRDKWWKLMEANKRKIVDPFYCFPDTVIVIPRDWPVK